MLEALVGIGVGVLTIVFARLIRGQRWAYAVGLLTLPALYASFALSAGEPAVSVRELTVGIPFIIAGLLFAFISLRWSAVVVGGFWILHALFDLTHDRFLANAGVPAWYPVFCFSVDVVVGAYLLWLARRIPDGNLRQA